MCVPLSWRLALVAGLLLSASHVRADALDRIPTNAVGFVHLKAAELWKSDAMGFYRKIIDKAGKDSISAFDNRFYPKPSSIVDITAVFMPTTDPRNTSGFDPIVIITTNSVLAPRRVIASLAPEFTAVKKGKQTLYTDKLGKDGIVFADDKTMLFGSSESILKLAANTGSDDKAESEEVALARKNTLTVALDIEIVQKLMESSLAPPVPRFKPITRTIDEPAPKEAKPEPEAAPVPKAEVPAELKPFLKAQKATLNVQMNKAIEGAVTLHFKTAADAKSADVTARKMLQLAMPNLKQSRAEFERIIAELGQGGKIAPLSELPQAGMALYGLASMQEVEDMLTNPPMKLQGKTLALGVKLSEEASSYAVTAMGTSVLAVTQIWLLGRQSRRANDTFRTIDPDIFGSEPRPLQTAPPFEKKCGEDDQPVSAEDEKPQRTAEADPEPKAEPKADVPLELKPFLKARKLTFTMNSDKSVDVALTLHFKNAADAKAADATARKLLEKSLPALKQSKAEFEKMLNELGKGEKIAPLSELPQAAAALYGLASMREFEEMLANPPMKLQGKSLVLGGRLPSGEMSSLVAASGLGVGLLLPATQKVRVAAARAQTSNNLKQMALAMFNYESANGMFPAASTKSPTGKPLLSWRVAILPYIEEEALYRRFKMDEPWDSPNNKALIPLMPKVFQHPMLKDAEPGVTVFRGFSGNPSNTKDGKVRTFMSDPKGTRFASVTDGTSNSFMFAEANEGVIWTKPDTEIDVQPGKAIPKLGGHFPGGFLVAMADGSVRFVSETVTERVLCAYIGIDDGEVADQLP